jgi:hypothetical protein
LPDQDTPGLGRKIENFGANRTAQKATADPSLPPQHAQRRRVLGTRLFTRMRACGQTASGYELTSDGGGSGGFRDENGEILHHPSVRPFCNVALGARATHAGDPGFDSLAARPKDRADEKRAANSLTMTIPALDA